MTEKEQVEKLCSKLFLENAYFLSVLAIHLNIQIKSDPNITAYADLGGNIVLGKEFISKLSVDQQIGLLAHELYHIAFLHPQYMKAHKADKDMSKCNIAMDYEINLLIDQDGLILPENPYLDYKYEGMTHQQIYDQLPNPPKNAPSVSIARDVKHSGDEEANENNTATPEEYLSDIEVAELVNQAAMQAEMYKPGSTSQSIQRAISEVLSPKMDWAELLKEYVVAECSKADYTWKKPNRRYTHTQTYLPSRVLTEDVIGTIAVCIDVSGSIDQELLDKFMAEVSGIVEDIRPKKTIVKLFDTSTKLTKVFLKEEPVTTIKLVGGGGTHIDGTFTELKKDKDDLLCVVVLTDMAIAGMANIPRLDTPVIWCRYGSYAIKPPYGKVIDLKE